MINLNLRFELEQYLFDQYDNKYHYTYNINIQKGGTSKYHPAPQNLREVQLTEEFYVIHYGKLNLNVHLIGLTIMFVIRDNY